MWHITIILNFFTFGNVFFNSIYVTKFFQINFDILFYKWYYFTNGKANNHALLSRDWCRKPTPSTAQLERWAALPQPGIKKNSRNRGFRIWRSRLMLACRYLPTFFLRAAGPAHFSSTPWSDKKNMNPSGKNMKPWYYFTVSTNQFMQRSV
jgi:hypothetical protein